MTEPKYPWYRGPRGRDVHPPPPEPETKRNAELFDAKRGIDRAGPTVESQRAVLDKPFAAKRVETASAVSKAETDSKDFHYIDLEVRRLQPKPYRVEMSGQLAVPGPVDPRTGQAVVSPSGPREFDLRGKPKPLVPLIGPELNAAAAEKLARPYEAASVKFSGPSVQSQLEAQDRPFASQLTRGNPQIQTNPDTAVEKASPRPARGEAAIWTPRGRVVVDRGAPSPGEDRTDIVQPPEATPNPASQLAGEEGKSPKYEPGPHDPKSKTTYVYSWAEYANPRRLAPKREPSPASEATAEGDNVDVPVDDSGGSGGA